MASLLTRKLVSLINLSPSFHPHHNLSILTHLFHFSIQIQQKEEDQMPFIAQYLISSFNFSKDRALKLASDKNLSPIKTLDRPESVIRFLKNKGLNDTQIKRAVSAAPQFLATNVSKSLEPRARNVTAGGFTSETLIQLIEYNPMALMHTNTVTRLQFWRDFVGSDKAFSTIIKKGTFINVDIDKKVIPRINMLREYGLSDSQISILLVKSLGILLQSEDSLKYNFEQIKKLGFPHGSKMYLEGLVVVSSMKKDTLDKKVHLFKTTYGWSQEEINLAIKKFPRLLALSLKNISSTMDFLIKKVGLDAKSISLWPTLLGYSLERRLIPRHYVLDVLKSKGLKNKFSFFSMVSLSGKKFVEKIILPHVKELPELGKAYDALCDGKMPHS